MKLIEKCAVFLALIVIIQPAYAWNIGSKGRVTGPVVHTTYFLTPNNQPFDVHAQAYVGTWANGSCQYNAQYDIGQDLLQTGNFVDIDAYQLKSVVGGGYSCMTIFYTYKTLVMETFQLTWDGINYTASIPTSVEVTIL
jgi:hypothetical protein